MQNEGTDRIHANYSLLLHLRDCRDGKIDGSSSFPVLRSVGCKESEFELGIDWLWR